MTHAIVAMLKPSDEQLPAIEERGNNLLVTAGAGSGKTLTLVARYLSLLAEGLPLRSVVAITFTRKAAREMRSRVRRQVQAYVNRPDLSPAERTRWQEVYEQLDAARISTIHTLCGELLRAHPAEAGVDPRFEMLDEGQTALMRGEAVRTTMGWAADDALASGLYSLLGERELERLAGQLLARRLEVAPLLADDGSLWDKWLAIARQPLQAFVENPQVQDGLAALQALCDDGSLESALAAGDAAAPDVAALAASWDRVSQAERQGDWVAVSSEVSAWEPHLKQRGRKENWGPVKPKDIIKSLQASYGALPAWLIKGDLAVDRELAEAIPAVRRLFERLCLAYQEARAARNALDFDDLEQMALDLLEAEHSQEVRARWQRDVRAILVDEFQDTNERQFRLIEQLNGDNLGAFYVGDAKQSIYRFRGADVSVFRKVLADATAGSAGRTARSLTTSYRAHRELLAVLNGVLVPALGEQAEGDLIAHRLQPGPGFAPPYVELHLTVGNRSGEGNALERAARALAARLARLLDEGVQVQDGVQSRPLVCSDIAILCRSSNAFGAYEDALEEADIPFLTVSGRGFYGRPEVRDLLNALRAIADPTDDLALAGLLRSPAIGLTDGALYQLCQQRKIGQQTLWDVIRADASDLDAAERVCVQRAGRLVTGLHARAGRTVVADLLKALLDETDYCAALRWAGQGRAARNVNKLLADALESGIVSVEEFLEYVAALRDAGTRESEARATAEGAVQILSVHAAKGLEFPVVVLGDVTADEHRLGGMLLDQEAGLLLPLKVNDRGSVIYGWALEQAQALERAEDMRLLYVAATRAQEMLLLSGCIKLTQAGGAGGLGVALGALAGPLGLSGAAIRHNEQGAAAQAVSLEVRGQPVGCWVYEPYWSATGCVAHDEMAVGAEAVVEPPLLTRCAPPGSPVAEPEDAERRGAVPGQRVWRVVPHDERDKAPSWVIGQLVHEALEAWRFGEDEFRAWATARAATLGLVDERREDAVRRSAELLGRFWQHALHDEMQTADQRLHEVPYSALAPDGSVGTGFIDALYRRGDAWTLVEFKTDRYVTNEERVRYARQAQRYQRAAEQLLGRRPRVLFCWLDLAGALTVERFEPTNDELGTTHPDGG